MERIVRPATTSEVVLNLRFEVDSQRVLLIYEGWAEFPCDLTEVEDLFKRSGLMMHSGTYCFQVTHHGVRAVRTPVGSVEFLGNQMKRSLLEAALLQAYQCLVTAYTNLPTDQSLPAIARAAVDRALRVCLIKGSSPSSRLDVLNATRFKGACASCAFTEMGASFSALLEDGPIYVSDVVTVEGVKVRAVRHSGFVTVVVGYLNHENPFEGPFHTDLVERLQLLLTPEFVRSSMQDPLMTLLARVLGVPELEILEVLPNGMLSLDPANEN